MNASGVKTRQAPTMTMVNTKRLKLDPQATVSRSTRSDLVAKRNSAISTTTARAAISNRNTTTKSKLISPSTINNQGTRSIKTTRQSTSREMVAGNKEMPSKLSSIKALPKKANGLPLLRTAVRSKLSLATANTNTSSARLSNRNSTVSSLARKNNPCKATKSIENLLPTSSIDMGIQTQEEEILNHSLLVGDIKFLNPSKRIVVEIEKLRNDIKTKQMLKATRKFEEHSEKQEEHLTDLKEFIEKSYVSKKQRPRKSRDPFEEDRKYVDVTSFILYLCIF